MADWSLNRLDGHAQAELIRSDQIAPDAAIEAAISAIEALDPAINSVSHRAFEHARAAVGHIDRAAPMAGVPYLLKDSLDYPGMPLRNGSRAKRNKTGSHAYPMAQRFDAAGLVPVGKSNMPEFGLNATGETLLYGPARNPWDLTRSAGGSSSGAAAAVALGLVPFAHGSDAGGSIRIPASNCGIVGFKPSRGWNVRARAYNLLDDIFCSDGLYGRSMRDTVWAARWLRPIEREGSAPARRLRIAVDLKGFDGVDAAPDVCAVIQKSAKLCEALGHTVENVRQPIPGEEIRTAFTTLWAFLGGEIVDYYSEVGGAPIDVLLEPWTIGLGKKRADFTPDDLATSLSMIHRSREMLQIFHERYDVVLSPVASTVPPLLGHLAPTRPFEELWAALFDYVNYTPLHNMSGAPSISLPLFASDTGLPVGSMFSARPGDDETLLALATELEAAQPWGDRWPAMAKA